MTTARGSRLLHDVALRILVRHLVLAGCTDVVPRTDAMSSAQGVDLEYVRGGQRRTAKVKADAYAGDDQQKVADRSLLFYRERTGFYGLETLADTFSRQPGWVQRSQADELLYYRVAIAQTEDEVAALMDEPDEVFFSELAVERDDLRIVPMRALQQWFATAGERYAPRPVLTDGRSSWYRLVPETDLEANVPGIERVGSIFARVNA
ncbi:hypothetical protein MX659_02735 [Coriobacteriia bacterium Es71-Z0120]|jgi:hypothetical protein|uniref:hypothetical protein n=1 Tax=Parvivirga hydrogeniphila TaxID=2939460 RepID=UPI002260EFB5|nr:hypothetical protein [Parvivirga hydrogeniphila]MCL4078519.1 hypothetical protein [Parvivirga hydrogeniphila]